MSFILEITDKSLGTNAPTTPVFPCRMSAMQYAAKHYVQKGDTLIWKLQADGGYIAETDMMSFRVAASKEPAPACERCQIEKKAGMGLTISK